VHYKFIKTRTTKEECR